MTIELRYQTYRLFPYERDLARREVSKLGLDIVGGDDSRILASGQADIDSLARLTYFKEVTLNGASVEPTVARMERQHLARRHPGRAPRQVTRYLVHGLHEYKGKFHPQLVRAFSNVLAVRPGDALIDPFAGSGTTLVEGSMLGAKPIGADLSPIAVLIAQAKLAVLQSPDRRSLARRLEGWGMAAATRMADAAATTLAVDIAERDADSVRYLRSWFDDAQFAGLSAGLAALHEARDDSALHLVGSVVLSSALRRASLQAPEDLRVRRRGPQSVPETMDGLFRRALLSAVDAVDETGDLADPRYIGTCVLQDVSTPGVLRKMRGEAARAAVITSPPYATALPYIDTDRFSIVALGLGTAKSLRGLESGLIGSREWSVVEQREWAARLNSGGALPVAVVERCQELQRNTGSDAGFRKRAVAALVFRYFTQMDEVFRELRLALNAGERAVFIVGVNRTGSGPSQTVIDTPNLLARIAERRGFAVDEVIPLETWPRYALHHANSVSGESAVVLTAS
jgi:Putative RNA methylase family UPF0020